MSGLYVDGETTIHLVDFVYNWHIRNFRYCDSMLAASVESPVFKTGVKKENEWILRLYTPPYTRSTEPKPYNLVLKNPQGKVKQLIGKMSILNFCFVDHDGSEIFKNVPDLINHASDTEITIDNFIDEATLWKEDSKLVHGNGEIQVRCNMRYYVEEKKSRTPFQVVQSPPLVEPFYLVNAKDATYKKKKEMPFNSPVKGALKRIPVEQPKESEN